MGKATFSFRTHAEVLGEQRHERCRHGGFSAEACSLDIQGRETPIAMPLCLWRSGRCPPGMERAWGGAVDYARDCAVCPVFDELL